MNKKIEAMILFSVFVGFIGFSSLFISGISFSEDDFGGDDFFHWKKRLIESKGSKDVVLLEMLGEAVGKPDGFTFMILQNHGPHLFYGKPEDNPNDKTVFQNNKKDFQRLLLNLFKTHDLPKFKLFYGIKDGESDLHVARVFEIVFYLYAPEIGFSYRLRENLKETLSWGWGDSKAPELLAQIIKSMDEFLGSKISYQIRARVKNIQSVGGTEKVAVVTEWELIEVESTYNPKEDKMDPQEKVIEKSSSVIELLDKVEADKIEGDYGTRTGLPLGRDAARAFFQSLSKTSKIFENPSPREIGSSNWERLTPLLPGGMSFVLIPAGTFDMGSPGGESGRYDNEVFHRVTIAKPFEMMTTEVTQKQWEKVMESNPSYFKGEDLPVERVSWNDVQAFIQKLNERNDGYRYRLPTEAEWEYAARGGTKTAYSFGDNPAFLKEHGWFSENSGSTTHPVKSCPTKEKVKDNGFDFYDMHGNVWEWVSDWYGEYPTGAVTDPTGPTSGSYRVVRGGSWDDGARDCRSANRSSYGPGGHGNGVGFRLARTRR